MNHDFSMRMKRRLIAMEAEILAKIQGRRELLFAVLRYDGSKQRTRTNADNLESGLRDAGALSDTDQEELSKIHDALTRIYRGDYGRCEACGGAISEDVLRVLPLATTCSSCGRRSASRVQAAN